MRIVAICNSRIVVIGFSHGKNSVLMTCSQKFSKLTCTSTCRIWHHNERRRREGISCRRSPSLCAKGERFDFDVTMVSCVAPHSRRSTLTLDTVAELLRNLFNTPGKWAAGILRSAFERRQCGKRRSGVNFSDASIMISDLTYIIVAQPYQWFNSPSIYLQHISAPHIYGAVLEALDLHPDSTQAFLCIGSGTGYLCAIAAEILGPKSLNFGKYNDFHLLHTSLLHCISLLPFLPSLTMNVFTKFLYYPRWQVLRFTAM